MRGKTVDITLAVAVYAAASMRPPQNAGENVASTTPFATRSMCFNEAPAECGGKRHVRHHAADVRGLASMRPPQNAGENPGEHHAPRIRHIASMRPPQNAGENGIAIYRVPNQRNQLQ